MRVKVYFNLHRKLFSVVSLEAHHKFGRVIDHVQSIVLDNVAFRVRPAGRARVLREKQKNIHAFVVGTISATQDDAPPHAQGVAYNPYLYHTFVLLEGRTPIYGAKKAWLKDKSVRVVDILKP